MAERRPSSVGQVRPIAADSQELYVLEAQHGVLLVDAEHHQDVLRRHAPAVGSLTQVIAELGVEWPPDGEQAALLPVEARIDGDRVGALAPADAGWYRPLLERALRQGLRPAVEGHVRDDGSGRLLVELFLPAGADALGSAEFPRPAPRAPVESSPPRSSHTSRALVGVGIAVAVLAVVGALGYSQWPRIAAWTEASRPATVAAAPVPTGVPTPEPAIVPTLASSTAPPVPAATSKVLPPITNGGCDPNYSGACVPIASHVECAGPGQEGPLLVRGPFRVVGTDVYVLDPDGDRIACGPPPPPSPAPAAPPRPATESGPTTEKRASAEEEPDEDTSDSADASDSSASADDN